MQIVRRQLEAAVGIDTLGIHPLLLRKTIALAEDCAWIVTDGKLLLEQQTGSRWKGLWKLPVMDTPNPRAKLLLAFDYPFTNHRVTLSIYATGAPKTTHADQRWVPLDGIDHIALAAPHKRAIKRLAAAHEAK